MPGLSLRDSSASGNQGPATSLPGRALVHFVVEAAELGLFSRADGLACFGGPFAADPLREGVLSGVRSQGRPAAAGFAGRFAVLDTGARREKIWLAIGAAARVWPRQIHSWDRWCWWVEAVALRATYHPQERHRSLTAKNGSD